MSLKSNTVSLFAKSTKQETKKKNETIVYGKIVLDEGNKPTKVLIDGSDISLPIAYFTTSVNIDERVIVMIKNHSAIVTGNTSSNAVDKNYVANEIKNIELSTITDEFINNLWSNYNANE